MKRYLFAVLALVLLSIVSVRGETREKFKNRYSVGAAFMPEWVDGAYDRNFSPSYGIWLNAQFSRHSGLELGVFHQQIEYVPDPHMRYPPGSNFGSTPSSAPYLSRHFDQYLSIRFGYKFFSGVVNFSTGIYANIVADCPQAEADEGGGVYLSISKDIRLYRGLILEPEMHVAGFFPTYAGLGLTLKYRF